MNKEKETRHVLLSNLGTKSCKQAWSMETWFLFDGSRQLSIVMSLSSFFTDGGEGAQCVAGCGFRLFGLRFEVGFTVLVPFKCGLRCGLWFLSICGSWFSLTFSAVRGFR